MWTSGDGRATFDAVAKLRVADPIAFDYRSENRQWVTDSRIGPALAELVACLAHRSAQAGGRGKVILVGHSMGGLAIRYAATEPVVGQRRTVGQLMGLAITIGTPHRGTRFFTQLPFSSTAQQAMVPGSEQLSRLPSLEQSGVAALYVASTIRRTWIDQIQQDGTDGVVPVSSAIPTTPLSGPGAGTEQFECSPFDCVHTKLPGSAGVRDAVTTAISAWLKANPLPTHTRKPRPSTTTTPSQSQRQDFRPFAGEWIAHNARLVVHADGSGQLEYRNYGQETGSGPENAKVTFRLTNFSQATVEGFIETSNVPDLYPIGERIEIDYLDGGVVEIFPAGRVSTLCDPNSYDDAICGA